MSELKEKIIKVDVLGAEEKGSPEPVERKSKVDKLGRAYATGKRKNSIARVWLTKGKGKITINGQDALKYLKRPILVQLINQPFVETDTVDKYDVVCTVTGGGLSGQAGAVRHGIAQALQNYDPDCRGLLKKEGLLTRDSRVVERKKSGKLKARKGRPYKKR